MSKELKLASVVILCGVAFAYSSCSPSSSFDNHPYVRVEFVSPSIGWIVGSKLLQTTDGGKTWRIVREGGDGTFISPTVVDSLHRFQFINQDVGLTVRNNVLKRRQIRAFWPREEVAAMVGGHTYESRIYL